MGNIFFFVKKNQAESAVSPFNDFELLASHLRLEERRFDTILSTDPTSFQSYRSRIPVGVGWAVRWAVDCFDYTHRLQRREARDEALARL
jgi:hypothetical protein